MRYYKKSGTISVSAAEMRRMFAYTEDYEQAWFQGEVMAKSLQVDDTDWDGMSAGNDFDINDTEEYGIRDNCGPFQIWQDPGKEADEFAEELRLFLYDYPTVGHVLRAQKRPGWPNQPAPIVERDMPSSVYVVLGEGEVADKDMVDKTLSKFYKIVKEEGLSVSNVYTEVSGKFDEYIGVTLAKIIVHFKVKVRAKERALETHASHAAWEIHANRHGDKKYDPVFPYDFLHY